jgi:L-threonylcarbamoyladenylate synthase
MTDFNIDVDGLNKCAHFLSEGNVIAFPTETVYGIGANALNEDACKNIYNLKGRPSNKGLICHLYDPSQGEEIAFMDARAYKLFEKFSPGPLTVVLKKKNILCNIVTGGLDTVALRLPSNKIFIELAKRCKFPIAGTSANISSQPSPKECGTVINTFNGRLPAIIDGGKTSVGIESTIVSLVDKKPSQEVEAIFASATDNSIDD